ncbi:hypothetical protein KP509_29G061400 [Ceratopteris richardii]|nr:hypothetical protein KP509_29G061400 [Ceratopteris richardii]KAH7292311.1 hypothetical protein KP509_29G061400 [Ceratopteris richardii]KAH7292312.1 hypothetical protein KP509_29G061400 [Ceratopteris richardii]
MALLMKSAMLRSRSFSSAHRLFSCRRIHNPDQISQKIVAVLYEGKEHASFNPKFLGCTENALGIREWLQGKGHEYIVTADKEGPNCELEKHIPDMHVLVTTPFHPAYMSEERIKKAKNLKLLLTAGVGSDHIDLKAAAAAGVTVAEITASNVVSVAEDELMRILILLRNFLPGYHQICNGEWDVAAQSYRAYDLEGKTVGTVGCGRIGRELLKRLKAFNCNLLYYDKFSIGEEFEKETGAKWEENLEEMLPKCDVVVINVPLTERTKGMMNEDRLKKMKKGAVIVNNARGGIMDRDAVVKAIENGQLSGYGGDVWYPQPAPKDHPWRSMPYHAMTPHVSGTTLDAQVRYSAGVKDVLDKFFRGESFPEEYYIVKEGKLASQYL